jgi:hypothetical protein
MATRIAALDLPDAVIELGLLDGDDALVEGHAAHHVLDCEVRGISDGWQQGCGQEERAIHKNPHITKPVFQDWG